MVWLILWPIVRVILRENFAYYFDGNFKEEFDDLLKTFFALKGNFDGYFLGYFESPFEGEFKGHFLGRI